MVAQILYGQRFSGTSPMLVVCLLLLLRLPFPGGTSVGVVYRTDSDELLAPDKVVHLLKQWQIFKVRLLDANPVVLQALAYSSIEVMVGVRSEEVLNIGKSRDKAFSWVRENILSHVPATNITAIAVGSEVTNDLDIGGHLVQACQNVYAALLHYRLDTEVKVSSPQSMLVLGGSLPPSRSRFRKALVSSIMQPLLSFLKESKSFLMVNVYPIQFYESLTQELDLDFALLQSNKGLDDPETKLHYSNMFDVLVDAMHTAMAALNYSDIGIVVTETGWPSKGDANETVASIDNAAIYNNNIIRHILNRTGTPMRPGVEVSTYIYELFNEEKPRGELYQQNWGLFEPNGTQAYGVKTLDTGQKSAVKAAARTWCVGRPWVSSDILLAALNWACGPGGAECGPIQLGEPCFVPNTVLSHASYAFNSYYQIHEHALGSCDFGGTAILTTEDPSTFDRFSLNGITSLHILIRISTESNRLITLCTYGKDWRHWNTASSKGCCFV